MKRYWIMSGLFYKAFLCAMPSYAETSVLSNDPAIAQSQKERCQLWAKIRLYESYTEMPDVTKVKRDMWAEYSRTSCNWKGYFSLYSDFAVNQETPSCMVEAGCQGGQAVPDSVMSLKEKCRLNVRLKVAQLYKPDPKALAEWKNSALKSCDTQMAFQGFRDYQAERYRPSCGEGCSMGEKGWGVYSHNSKPYNLDQPKYAVVKPSTTSNTQPSSQGGNSDATFFSNCKRGIAYGKNTQESLRQLSKGVHWWYNWAAQPEAGTENLPADIKIEYVPMIWGKADIGKSVPSSAKTVLGFNEPNFFEQSNMSPGEAAGLWSNVVQAAEKNKALVASPAVNFCGGGCWDTDPISYLDKFLAACPSCKIDYIAIHSYTGKVEYMRNYINRFKKYNKPIWLTEFACYHWENGAGSPCSLDEQKAFMSEAIPYLEEEPSIARYAWFSYPNIPNSELVQGSQLTELGKIYVDAPGSCPK